MIATALLLALATVKDVPDRCTLCHPDVRVEFERSVHRAEDVTCTACHGGDAAAVTVEAAHRRSFRGVPERRDIPRLCASCHSDVARMRPYNLPSDQFALYQTSTHGQKLAGGDDGVAVCTDCHGVHDILRPEDPASRVSIKNVPRTCARCHGDPIRMSRYGMRADAYSDYAASVHGRALLEQGNLSAPNCTRCHGSHGATPPGVGDVDKVCGQCHAATRSYFLEGPHKDALGTVGYAECASCHGHHQTPPAKAEMLDTVCLKCHAAKSAPLAVAARMKALYVGASE